MFKYIIYRAWGPISIIKYVGSHMHRLLLYGAGPINTTTNQSLSHSADTQLGFFIITNVIFTSRVCTCVGCDTSMSQSSIVTTVEDNAYMTCVGGIGYISQQGSSAMNSSYNYVEDRLVRVDVTSNNTTNLVILLCNKKSIFRLIRRSALSSVRINRYPW